MTRAKKVGPKSSDAGVLPDESTVVIHESALRRVLQEVGGSGKDKEDDDSEDPKSGWTPKELSAMRKELRHAMDDLQNADPPLLREKILRAAARIVENRQAKANDTKLERLKEKVADAEAPYREVEKHQRAVLEYSMYLLEQHGAAIATDEDDDSDAPSPVDAAR